MRRFSAVGLGALAVLAVVLVAAFVLTAELTDRSSFCRTCHEMRPYNDAWARGKHAGVACVECHVDPGRASRYAHKLVALQELAVHAAGDPRFPLSHPTPVPDSRCLRCHRAVAVKVPATVRFSHAAHAKEARCWECHATTGHAVTLDALRAEGVLDPKAAAPRASVVGSASAEEIKGHVAVTCTRCHDPSRMACATCHAAPHRDKRGPCEDCHRPGRVFAFVHTPRSGSCRACHKPPANHFGPDCGGCHKPGVPFARTTFVHPPTGAPHSYTSFPCAQCHPGGFTAVSCTCHGGGRPTGD